MCQSAPSEDGKKVCVLESVIISQGCQNKSPQTGWLNRNQIFSHGSRGQKAEVKVSTGSVPSRGSVNVWTGWLREWSTWKFSLWIKTQCLLPTFPFFHPCPCPISPPGTSQVYRASVRREGSCTSISPAPTSLQHPPPPTLFLYCYCYSVAQSCPTLCDSMDCSRPGFPVLHHLLELAQTHVHWVGDAIQPPHPLASPSPPTLNLAQHQGVFQWIGSSHQVAKV